MTNDTPSRQGYFNASTPSFSEDGRPEASVDFVDPFASEPDPDAPAADEQPAISPEAWLELFDYVAMGADSRIVSGRAWMIARLLRLPSAPHLEDLANSLSMSPTTCRRRVATLSMDLQGILQRSGGASV